MRLNQALHGYKDGHRLLASSVNIPPLSQRLMQLLSDLSGVSQIRGFETYLTGYPLPEMGAYALARTWYAAEMKRPGCVWTHSLIVAFDELDKLSDLSILNNLFVRPEFKTEHIAYLTPLDVPDDRFINDKHVLRNVPKHVIYLILNGLYGFPDNPVVVGGKTAENLEELSLVLWSQQWPRLRRNFTYCTGAISPRYWQDKLFDLQIAPIGNIQEFARVLPGYRIITDDLDIHNTIGSWQEAAVMDLTSQATDGLRSFLWQFSTDISSLRAAYEPLASFYDVLISDTEICKAGTLIEALARRFPNPQQAAKLKIALLSQGPWHERVCICSGGIEAVLEALASTAYYTSLPVEALRLRPRTAEWAKDNLNHSAHLLTKILQLPITSINEQVIGGILDAIGPNDVFSIAERQPQLMPMFVNVYPMLAADSRVWQTPTEFQYRVWEEVRQHQRSEWKPVIAAMLEAPSVILAEEVLEHTGYEAFEAVILWAEEKHCKLSRLPDTWRRGLANHPHHLLSWLGNPVHHTSDLLPEILLLLDPNSNLAKGSPAHLWLSLSESMMVGTNIEASGVMNAFLLTLSFGGIGPVGSHIASASFEPVHNAARLNRLHHQALRWLQPHLPHYTGFRGWDECAKLREAFVERCIRYQWPQQAFLDALTNPQTLEWMIATCRETTERKKYLDHVIATVKRGQAKISLEQHALLLPQKKHKSWF